MPHGPTHAVNVLLTPSPFASAIFRSISGGGILDGWPDSIKSISGAGPYAPIFLGVWQSLHPPIVTRCSPHFSALPKPPYIGAVAVESVFNASAAVEGWLQDVKAVAPHTAIAKAVISCFFMCRVW